MDREMMMGVEPNQVNHIYIQAAKDGKLQKLYIRYNDGYVDLYEVVDSNKTEQQKMKEITEMFKAMGVSKVKNRDYSVALATDKIFDQLESKLAEQRSDIDFDFDLDIPEEAHISDLHVNKGFLKGLFNRNKATEKNNFVEDSNLEAENNSVSDSFDEIPSEEFEPINDENLEEEEPIFELEKDENAKLNPKHAAVVGGVIALAIAIGACTQLGGRGIDDTATVAATSGASVEEVTNTATPINKPSMEGQEYDYYVSYATEGLQKSTMVNYHDYVMNFNRSEDWMYQELTPEMIEELEKMSITIDGNEAIFGFTAEEVNALNLVYGTYTNEEYTQLMNGQYIDVTKVMSSSESEMNQAIRKVIFYYLNSDSAYAGIENVVNFTDSEKEQIKKFEDMFQEYKDLLKEEKYSDAESKMKEIKTAVLEYAHAQDTEVNNAKPYILRTLVPAFSIYSTCYQYMDTITLNLYDNTSKTYTTKNVKTWLWDEITMRDLVEGYDECKDENGVVYQDGFSEIEFLNSFNISSSKYSLVISDDGVSIADSFVGGLENKLSGYNDYAEKLRTENSSTDALVQAQVQGADITNNTEFDTLTSTSYDQEIILEMIDNELVKENKYPKNTNFFSSMYSKFVKKVIEFKDTVLGGTSNSTGKDGGSSTKVISTTPTTTIYVPGTTTTVTWTETHTETYVETRTEKRPVSEEEIAAEDAANRAKAVEEASKTTVTDGATGQQKETTYQDIYNKSVNDNTGGKTNLDTNLDNDDKVNAGDSDAQKVQQWAQEDAQQINEEYEKASEGATETYVDEQGNTHYVSGGEEHIDEEYQNADTASESEAEAYNRMLEEQKTQTSSDQSVTPQLDPQPESQPEPQQESQPAPQEEYTQEDPTSSESFAPAYEEEVDAIINEMANETSTDQATEGMSK